MSASQEIAAAGDDMIHEYPPRENSGYVDYALGKGSVCYRGGADYLCGSCSWPDSYQTAEHKGCAHIVRIVKYRAEHSA